MTFAGKTVWVTGATSGLGWRFAEVLACLLRLDRPRFQKENAGDDLEAVVDPMMHLLEQEVLLAQQLVLLAFQPAPRRHVLDRHQQARAVVALIEHLPRVQQHAAPAGRVKVVLDLIVFDRRMLRDDVL